MVGETREAGSGKRVVDCQRSFARFARLLQFLKHRDERRQFVLDGAPHDVQLDIEVRMNKAIAHADYLLPRNLWMLTPKSLFEPRRRFTHNLETPNECMLQQSVAVKVRPRKPLDKTLRFQPGIYHVPQ